MHDGMYGWWVDDDGVTWYEFCGVGELAGWLANGGHTSYY